MRDLLHKNLYDVFGYKEFREQQEQIIYHLLEGNDALVIMPTGGGKSMCYQLPAVTMPGITLVISPLLALMKDQVAALSSMGVSAYALNSHTTSEERRAMFHEIQNNSLDILYVSPERATQESFINYFSKCLINLIAVDEAHCVSTWGNDFRPDYAALSQLKDSFPDTPFVALTATADASTQDDILRQLRMDRAEMFIGSFERKNITIQCLPGQRRKEQIIRFLGNHPNQSGIIYCLSRKSTESLAQSLKDVGILAESYHAGKSQDDRIRVQEDFMADHIQIVVATIAFGMGIDKSNISWVIHYDLPKNLESYYQEIGRAGRDGSPAEAILFYSYGSFLTLQRIIEDSQAEDGFKGVLLNKLERMWAYCNTSHCRTNVILNYFDEYRDQPCGHCDNCLNPPTLIDATKAAQMALSAVVRSKESLTMTVLMDVLKARYSPEVKKQGLDRIKTFGVGRDYSYNQWRHYINQFIQQGLLRINLSKASRLECTPLSKAVLKGEKEVMITEYERPADKAKKKAQSKIEFNTEHPLFEQLRAWRTEKAQSRGVPPYIILNDKTLHDLTAKRPDNMIALLDIDGIGKVKQIQYGEELLDLIAGYEEES